VNLSVNGRVVQLPSGPLELPLPVLCAALLGEQVVAVHDYSEFSSGQPASNLVCYSLRGEQLWVGQNPSKLPADAFVSILSERPLRVSNFIGCNCTIELSSGAVLSSEVTK
jgi:hypothetical protein